MVAVPGTNANISNKNEYLNFKRPTFPLVVAPSGKARSGSCDSK